MYCVNPSEDFTVFHVIYDDDDDEPKTSYFSIDLITAIFVLQGHIEIEIECGATMKCVDSLDYILSVMREKTGLIEVNAASTSIMALYLNAKKIRVINELDTDGTQLITGTDYLNGIIVKENISTIFDKLKKCQQD